MTEYEVVHEKSPAFFDKFERKAELQQQTHYCPGCGHGVAHKLIAEALTELGLQDRAVFVSPVGCSVFAYYYFDVGNVQAAHGRASAVATALKRAHPDSIVISYQGDGDLAAIGTAEIVHAANRGENICVFFVNNSIYGMTGGQLAPTTLPGQYSTTSPWGRRPSNEGLPLHVAELLAALQTPTYIERVALSDMKNIMKAKKAIRKALEIQKNGGGFSLVEILSPCPTILKMDPLVARKWVGEALTKEFPLGVFRDRKPELPESAKVPHKTIAEALGVEEGASEEKPSRRHHTREITVNFAGFGGQGILLMGQLLAEMGLREQMEVSWLPSYGPEMRSGSAHCYVTLSHERIGSPLSSRPEVLVAMNEISLRKFASSVLPGGLILYNADKLPADFTVTHARAVCIPVSEMADRIGTAKVANVVMLGALLEETGCLPTDTAIDVLKDTVKNPKLLELDKQAIVAGRDYVDTTIEVGAVAQPDGYSY
ncbi:MAG TPA: 2-oxoacid:acceptor oxidoreductase family protein [Candidatus Methylomirabilis sp.]|nr:2-oxoacid:acceptor oxidoreductase family protein [Candidatus Methylomirabilis sp.]